MKKLIIFISFDLVNINVVCENMKSITSKQEFCGFWGKIGYNKEECLRSISATINYFIESDKEAIYFGCDENDIDDLLLSINTKNCEIIKIKNEEFSKNSRVPIS